MLRSLWTAQRTVSPIGARWAFHFGFLMLPHTSWDDLLATTIEDVFDITIQSSLPAPHGQTQRR
jgi:hypothetical protein